jgi:hypothetical protein
LLVTLLSLAVVSPALAQHTPIVDVSGGYSRLSNDDETLNGWYATAGGNITRWFALVADVNGHYFSESLDAFEDFPGGKAKFDTIAILGGPRFTFRSERFAVFAHVKGGVVTFHSEFMGFKTSQSEAALEAGGGLDVWLAKRVGLRLGVDGRAVMFEDEAEGAFRFHAGVVVGLGTR